MLVLFFYIMKGGENKMNTKCIKNWKLSDVRSFMGLVISTSNKKNQNYYAQFEDRYSDNPYSYISTSKTHSGGGRITVAYVMAGNTTILNCLENGEKYYGFDVICQKLYDYIQENY